MESPKPIRAARHFNLAPFAARLTERAGAERGASPSRLPLRAKRSPVFHSVAVAGAFAEERRPLLLVVWLERFGHLARAVFDEKAYRLRPKRLLRIFRGPGLPLVGD